MRSPSTPGPLGSGSRGRAERGPTARGWWMTSQAIVFHCPSCGTDRVGELRRGRWSSWLHDNDGAHVRCSGCLASYQMCSAQRGPVGTSYRAALNLAVRAMAASVHVASDGDSRATAALVEFVRACSHSPYSAAQLRSDASDARLEERLRGDLRLLATKLDPQAADQLVAQLEGAVEAAGQPTSARSAVIATCARYLGASGRV
jgi:hypothetical protein